MFSPFGWTVWGSIFWLIPCHDSRPTPIPQIHYFSIVTIGTPKGRYLHKSDLETPSHLHIAYRWHVQSTCSRYFPSHQLHCSIPSFLHFHASRMLFYFIFFFHLCMCACEYTCLYVCIIHKHNAYVWMHMYVGTYEWRGPRLVSRTILHHSSMVLHWGQHLR